MTDTLTQSQQAILNGLSEDAKADIRDGNCILSGDICVCGSSVPVKGELAHHRLASFPIDLDRGCLLTPDGLAIREALLRTTLLQANRNGK